MVIDPAGKVQVALQTHFGPETVKPAAVSIALVIVVPFGGIGVPTSGWESV